MLGFEAGVAGALGARPALARALASTSSTVTILGSSNRPHKTRTSTQKPKSGYNKHMQYIGRITDGTLQQPANALADTLISSRSRTCFWDTEFSQGSGWFSRGSGCFSRWFHAVFTLVGFCMRVEFFFGCCGTIGVLRAIPAVLVSARSPRATKI